jgi:hypothetical protein
MSDDTKQQTKPAGAADSAGPKPIEPLRGIVKGLPENRLYLSGASDAQIGNRFIAMLPLGTTLEDALEPAFWAHNAPRLHHGDSIELQRDDMCIFGLLYVRDVSGPAPGRQNNRAVVDEVFFKEFDAVARDAKTKSHEVVHLGPHLRWCVRALKDQRVVKEGCGTAEEAAAWMRSHAA